ncbi:MAG: methyltransferase protein [Flavipsychrobacter sp.]|jgi:ubiquinone/menaquinone biosynthesis C-methylase UbiE|nr:methyltransferase protein [Flavipsychrobacter sp.]
MALLISPDTHEPLREVEENGAKYLTAGSGQQYRYLNGFADLTFPKVLTDKEKTTLDFYENRADVYDQFLYQTFKTHGEDEVQVRNTFIDKLNLKTDSKVLEIACGTGRDSELIANRLGKNAQLVLQDISPSMLKKCSQKLEQYNIDKQFCISNAAYLPFPDNYFDATYSFGGLGEFPDIKRSLAEMVRVTKVGGKIVVGDESMPPWLRDTYFCKVLATTNPQFLAEIPFKEIPVEARKVTVQWVIGGIFYLLDFEVGNGEPVGDFDYEIEGVRGGTLRTRLEGQLEGVTKEAKEMAIKAASKKGLSMHAWLDEVVRQAAKKDLL